jgi:hypothetical protein
MKRRLKALSRELTVADQSFKIGKFTLKTAQVSAAVGNYIDQGPYQKVPLRTKPLPLAFIGDPLVTKNLQDLADFL